MIARRTFIGINFHQTIKKFRANLNFSYHDFIMIEASCLQTKKSGIKRGFVPSKKKQYQAVLGLYVEVILGIFF